MVTSAVGYFLNPVKGGYGGTKAFAAAVADHAAGGALLCDDTGCRPLAYLRETEGWGNGIEVATQETFNLYPLKQRLALVRNRLSRGPLIVARRHPAYPIEELAPYSVVRPRGTLWEIVPSSAVWPPTQYEMPPDGEDRRAQAPAD